MCLGGWGGVGGGELRKMYHTQITICTYYLHALICSATAIQIGGDSGNSNIKGLFHRSEKTGPCPFVLINNTLRSKCMSGTKKNPNSFAMTRCHCVFIGAL